MVIREFREIRVLKKNTLRMPLVIVIYTKVTGQQ